MIIKSGEKIDVLINRKRRKTAPDSKETESKRGLILPRKTPDYLPRRLSPGYINFYDFWQYKSSSQWTDKIFSQLLPASDVSLIDALKEPLLIDQGIWTTQFRRITHAEARSYRFAFSTDENPVDTVDENRAEWTTSGLKFSEAIERMRFSSSKSGDDNFVFYDSVGGLFQSWDTAAADVKITSEPNYESAAAALALTAKKNISVFLNASLFVAGGTRLNYFIPDGSVWSYSTEVITTAIFTGMQYPFLQINPNTGTAVPFAPDNNAPEKWAFERTLRESASSSSDLFHFGNSFEPIISKVMNWRRLEELPQYVEHTEIIAALNQAIMRLSGSYGGRGFNRTLQNRGLLTVQPIRNPEYPGNPFGITYHLRGSWAGFPDRDWMQNPGYSVTIGNETDSSTAFQIASGAGAFGGRTINLPDGSLLAVIIQGENSFYVWRGGGGGGGET